MHEELQTPAFLKGSTQIHFILIKPLSCADTCCTFKIIFSSAENTKLFLFYLFIFLNKSSMSYRKSRHGKLLNYY